MITVSFIPVHLDLSVEEHEAKIAEYRAWLDQHGDYGRLYMMDIDKRGLTGTGPPAMVGIRFFDDEIATLFKLMFEV
jgi:hypothetical protein